MYILRTNLFIVFEHFAVKTSASDGKQLKAYTSRTCGAVASFKSSKVFKHWLPFGVGRYACGAS